MKPLKLVFKVLNYLPRCLCHFPTGSQILVLEPRYPAGKALTSETVSISTPTSNLCRKYNWNFFFF